MVNSYGGFNNGYEQQLMTGMSTDQKGASRNGERRQ
jgi:hypothetical protein